MTTLTHAKRIEIHTEEGGVTFDMMDEVGALGLRRALTPDQAEMLAAELLVAAEKARNLFLAGVAT